MNQGISFLTNTEQECRGTQRWTGWVKVIKQGGGKVMPFWSYHVGKGVEAWDVCYGKKSTVEATFIPVKNANSFPLRAPFTLPSCCESHCSKSDVRSPGPKWKGPILQLPFHNHVVPVTGSGSGSELLMLLSQKWEETTLKWSQCHEVNVSTRTLLVGSVSDWIQAPSQSKSSLVGPCIIKTYLKNLS